MADDKKPDGKKDDKKDDGAAKGGGTGKLIVFGVLVVLLAVGGSVGGAMFLAPKLAGKQAATAEKEHKKSGSKEHDDEEEEEDGKETKIFHTLSLDSMIVDVRSDQGEVHHLKIGMAIEIKAQVPEEELKGFVPRARDAAITYLRTLTPPDIMSNQRFEAIRKELSERIIKAVGRKFVSKVLITDFVVQ